MVFKAKWVLAFAFASVASLLLLFHLNPEVLQPGYDKLKSRHEFTNGTNLDDVNIMNRIQSLLGIQDLPSINNIHGNVVSTVKLSGRKFSQDQSEEDEKPKIAYIFAGSARSFACPRVHWSIKAHLIDALGGDPHVFVRLSLEDNVNVKTGLGVLKELDYSQNEVLDILKILDPKKVEYFKFSDQEILMKELFPGDGHTVFRENDLRRYSMFFHRCMAYKMATEYEKLNSIRFDWVVLVRLDAGWLEPVLPIGAYRDDRVWATETGYDVFNDQFMLIPRQYSDYLYDLNTKVQQGVYCLGGPDVETWKCNATQLANKGLSQDKIQKTLAHCCEDILKGNNNLMGMSEAIHKRHLKYGKIPISIARFPVFLTRRLVQKGKVICHPECFRIYSLHYNEYLYRSGGMPQLYEFMASTEWPDRRSVGISSRDRVLCYYLTREDAYPWKPLSAAAPEMTSQLKSPDFTSSRNSISSNGSGGVDYSLPLAQQVDVLHSSILQNPKDTEVWRIRPSWNTEGCLTFMYETKELKWQRCFDHSRMKRARFDSRQLFFLHVIPLRPKKVVSRSYHIPATFPESTYSSEVSNVTRLLVVDAEPQFWDFQGHLYCLTVDSIAQNAPVHMAKCSKDKDDPKQNFLTVRTVMDGSTPQTALGQLQVASAPHLCLARADNAPPNKAVLKFERERTVLNDHLELKLCKLLSRLHLVTFEFELVNS